MAKRKQRYEPWEIRDFAAGQVEKLNDNILPDNAAHECRNFISSRFGGLSKRKGQTRLNAAALPAAVQGLHAYYARSSNIRRLIAFAQGLGYLWDGNTFTPMVPEDGSSLLNDFGFPYYNGVLVGEILYNQEPDIFPLNASAPVLFEDAVNYVVAFNGVDLPWKWNGTYITTLSGAPSKGRYPILHKEKLFCVDADEPSTLRWSESFDPEDWSVINYWDIRKGDGDEITALVRFMDDLIIFKNRSIHVLKGTSLDDFNLQEISDAVGCVGPRAVTTHDLKVYFVSEWGIYVTNGLQTLNITEMAIPDLWERVNPEAVHLAALAVWDDMVRISLPMDGSNRNNFTLYYDTKKQAFWPMTNTDAICYETWNDGQGLKLYAGDSRRGYVNIQDEGTEDFGVAIDAYWKGKHFEMGMPEVEKKARKIYVQDSPNSSERVEFSVATDYGDYEELEYTRKEGLSREFLLTLDQNRWRYISPMIAHNSTGECEVRGIVIPYKPKSRMAVRADE